jgi:6-phosphofructokinase 1
VLQEKFYKQMADLEYSLKFQRSTARELIYCDPSKTKVAISMIGELCPGKNVVLRSLVKCLEFEYGVKDIYGIKWGFRGFCEDYPNHWLKINSASLESIQH